MKTWDNIKKYFKRYWAPVTIAGYFGLGVYGGVSQTQKMNQIKEEKAKTEQSVKEKALPKVKNPLLNISYQNDTLSQPGTALYLYFAGKITRYYVDKNNRYKLQLPYLAHEEWHRHNNESFFRFKYYYTPTDYYKLCMHNEISANMAAILTARYEYLAAPTKAEKRKIVNRYKNTYMKFYFDEVAKGKIKPESKNPKDIEKERKLIANGTLNMWLDKFTKHYRPAFYAMLQTYVGNVGLATGGKKSYNSIRDYMYTIGGVNFADYFEHDIELKEEKVLLAEQLPKIKFMKSGGVEIMNIVNQNIHLLQQVGMDKQSEIFQNLLISSQLKYMLRNKTAEEIRANPKLVNLCYRKIMNNIYTDNSFAKVVKEFPMININRQNIAVRNTDFAEIAKQMYAFQGIDLTTMITDFSPENVPIPTALNIGFENRSTDNFMFLSPQMSAELEKSLEKQSFPKNSVSPINKPSVPKRLSEVMHINLPNLREPILLYATPEDEAKIFASLREFEAIPLVFKNCDTAEQQKYLKKHPEYADSLKTFQTKGSFTDIATSKKNNETSR